MSFMFQGYLRHKTHNNKLHTEILLCYAPQNSGELGRYVLLGNLQFSKLSFMITIHEMENYVL